MNLKFLTNEFQNIDPDEGRLINFNDWEDIPQNISLKDIRAIYTQRFRDSGLIDHIQIELSESSSTYLGLWILGCYHQNKHPHYSIDLAHQETDVKKIKLCLKNKSLLNASLNSFKWYPELIDDFKQPAYCHLKPHINLTLSTNEMIKNENYDKRDVLEGFGELNSACALAEYFLNFGHNISKDTNYDYLKEKWSRNFLDDNSCEVRMFKLNAPRTNIFTFAK